MLGQNTQFNRDLWNSTTNTEPTPIVPPNNQLFTYLEERRNFAFGIEGDWEVNKYNRYAKELRMPSAEQKLSSYNAESKTK